jgi:hypothetical protein
VLDLLLSFESELAYIYTYCIGVLCCAVSLDLTTTHHVCTGAEGSVPDSGCLHDRGIL